MEIVQGGEEWSVPWDGSIGGKFLQRKGHQRQCESGIFHTEEHNKSTSVDEEKSKAGDTAEVQSLSAN